MRVLLTNDDGFDSIGIRILAEAIKELRWDAVIVAPHNHMSGASRGRVSNLRLPWKKVERLCGFDTYWVEGSPAGCVVFGLTSSLLGKFDLCISGINAGENLGAGLTISGTFGAALEAISYGVKAIAISREYDEMFSNPNTWNWSHTRKAAVYTLSSLVETIEEWKLANVNIPNYDINRIIHTFISKESYFNDYYNIQEQTINSEMGFDLNKIEINDDIHALRVSRVIGVTLLKGMII